MLRWFKLISILVGGLFGLALFAVWLVLSSSLLAKARGALAARLLSSELGQVVEITGGVVVDLGAVLHVTARGLALPSQTLSDVSLAEVGQLEFELALRDLIRRRIKLSNIQVVGAKASLVVDQEGSSPWSQGKAISAGDAEKPAPEPDGATTASSARNKNEVVSVTGFLAGNKIRFLNSGVTYRDARNGLDLDLILASFEIGQTDRSAPVVLEGTGTLNGQDLSLTGVFPQERPFKVTAAFSQISVDLDGTPDPGGYDAGYEVAISANIAELGQLLDVLKLNKSVSGTGNVSAVFKKSIGSARIEDLNVLISLDGGQSLELTADLGELGNPSDITIDTKIRLYSEANTPAPTKKRLELKLIGIDMQLIAQPDGMPTRRMVIETNGFVLDTGGVGPPPISFSQISRTPDGLLRVGKMVLRIGPPQAPFVVLEGAVADALQLEGIDIEGTLALPMANLLAPQLLHKSTVLGRISGGFRLIGSAKNLSLSDLNAASQDTVLWRLVVTGAIGNAMNFSDVNLDIVADVLSGAELLNALGLKPIKTGPVKLNTNLSSLSTEWNSEVSIAVADSQLDINVFVDFDEPVPTVRGQIESDLINVEQLRDIAAAVLQLARLSGMEMAATKPNAVANSLPDNGDGKKTELLVLEKSEKADPDRTQNLDGYPPDGPEGSQQPSPFRDVTLQPVGQAILLSGMDLSVQLDLRKIEGDKGSSSLKSDLEMKDQIARLGPLKFEYGGAYFDIEGSMNLIDDPDILKLSGSTGGWDFGNIMQELRFKKSASGVVDASFDLSGSHVSVRNFLGTMAGSATVSMRNGSIDSQLLDLAGLGVIPWLFSKDQGKIAPIVCIRAPLQFSNGRISSEQTVVETDRVQIVVLGNVDLKGQTLDIVGQPRRIGKPLSRSPWPFTAVGPMAKPKIRVKDGPRRLRRSDGATTMPQRRQLCVPDILQLK